MIEIRKATQKDIKLLVELANKIWPNTYLEIIGRAQIDYMLELMYNEAELLNQINSGHTFLIAEENEKALGFAGFSQVDIEEHIYKLEKLYILPETQGRGLGKHMVNEVLELVSMAGGKSLILNVNKYNNAREFYKKIGFKILEEANNDIGGGFFMDDYVMGISISESKE